MIFPFKRILLFLFLTISFGSNAQTLNVCFVGNSYTGYNNLPDLFRQLALSAGEDVYVDGNPIGGYSLSQHLDNPVTIDLIKEGIWNFVVLQEYSIRPVIPYYRDNYTYPAADSLNKLIHTYNTCVSTTFYMTWGRKYGGTWCIGSHCSPDFVDYFHMQDSLEAAYMTMAYDNQAFCAPVGISWSNSIANGDPIELYTSDGSHPTLAGSYLAACTFYATIFNKSPEGIAYTAGLNIQDAAYLQQIAAFTVLNNPSQWNITHPEPVHALFTYELQEFHAQFWNESINATAYLWDFGDPASGVYNISDHINPSHNYTGPGTYIVTLEAGHPCLDGDVYRDTLTIVEVGIPEKDVPEVVIYPNPTNGSIHILPANNFTAYHIYDHAGNCCLIGEIENAHQSIQVSHLRAGIYLLEMKNERESLVQKIVIR